MKGGEKILMSNSRIGRNVETTSCKGEYYDKNFKKWPFEIKVFGHYDLDHMVKKVRAVLETDHFIIEPDSIVHESFWASMPIESFVEQADKTYH